MQKTLLYILRISLILGCSKFFAQQFFFTLPASPPYCVNQGILASITSTPQGAVSFSWSVAPPSIISVVSATQALITFTSCGQPTVFCTAIDAAGNPVGLSGATTSVICPGLTITPMTQTICPGATATLMVTGANSYTWSNAQNGAVINPAPQSSSSYSVIGDNINGCGASASVKIMSLNINASYPLACPGNTVALNAFGSNTYSWTGSTFINPIPQNSISVTAGTYTVSSASSSGICTKSITIYLAPPLSLMASVSPIQGTTCIETNYPKVSKPIIITVGGGFPSGYYVWYPPIQSAPNGPTVTIRPLVSTCYTVVAIDPNSAGSASAVACVSVIPQFTMNVSPATSTICIGDSIKLSVGNIQTPLAVGPASLMAYYWWDPPTSPPPSITAQNTPTVKAFPQTNSTYSIEVFDASGCASMPFLVTVNTVTCLSTAVASSDYKYDQFRIYPNPFDERLFVQTTVGLDNLSLQLTDVVGKQISSDNHVFNSPENTYAFDASKLKPGVYFVILFSNQKIISRYKVLKN